MEDETVLMKWYFALVAIFSICFTLCVIFGSGDKGLEARIAELEQHKCTCEANP